MAAAYLINILYKAGGSGRDGAIKNHRAVGAGHAPPAVLWQWQYCGYSGLPAKSPLHTKTGRFARNSALFSTKTGQLVHNRQVSAERRKSSKKFCKNAKKHLQFVRCRAIIILGCERLVQIVTSVLRKPRYALMREVACAAWRRVFPRSMSDLRTGRKNYGNKGICTLLHSAARTNVRFYFVMFLSGRTVQTRFTGFCHG